MIVIGLTGNIGTGKSTVAQILKRLGAEAIDADKLGHDLLKPGSAAYQFILTTFGSGVLSGEGIDRRKLARLAFADPVSLAKLNEIMHPRIQRLANELLEEHRKRGAAAVVLEATLLLEAGWTPMVDQIWMTKLSGDLVVERLIKQKGLAKEDIIARARQQMTQEEKARQADVVIDTSGSREELEKKVIGLWHSFVKGEPLPKAP